MGINIIFGLSPAKQTEHYFSTDPFLGNEGVRSVFTLRRYKKINQYIHVSERSAEPARGSAEFDVLYKILPIYRAMQKSFPAHHHCSENLSLDEALVKTKGKISIRQFMPNKVIYETANSGVF